MKQLVVPAILAASSVLATGCFFVDDDDDDFSGVGFFGVSWELDPGCPAGATTAQALSQRVDASGNAIGSPIEDLFDCEDGRDTTDPLPLGLYEVTLNITDESTDELFAQSVIVEAELDLDEEVVSVDFDILTDQAFFFLTWTIDGDEATTAACDAAGADAVRVLATLASSGDATTDSRSCDDGGGETSALPLGDYVLEIDLVDAAGGGVVIADGPAPFEETLAVGNESNDIGDFDFVP